VGVAVSRGWPSGLAPHRAAQARNRALSARACSGKSDQPLSRGPRALSDKVLILDFGSQVTQLIARRVRESGVYCEVLPVRRGSSQRLKAFDAEGRSSCRVAPPRSPKRPARRARRSTCSSRAFRCSASATAQQTAVRPARRQGRERPPPRVRAAPSIDIFRDRTLLRRACGQGHARAGVG
jgi:hypothetical protein